MNKPLYNLSVQEAAGLLAGGELSAVELCQAVLKRIEQVEDEVKAYITLTPELALDKAKHVDEKRSKRAELSPLAGIPVSIKDSFVTKGIRTTVASKVLGNYIGQYDATVVERLKAADAVIVGKTNLDEFSLGFTTETSAFQVTGNPWDTSRTPGGSSGGAAASVAAGQCLYGIGSEHYDSVRQPAAWCGVTGFKGTYGTVSRYGIVAMASSLECPGVLAQSAYDAGLVFSVISGHDDKDANSLPRRAEAYHQLLATDIKGMKIGIADEYFDPDIEPGVLAAVEQALAEFKNLGVELVKIELPPLAETSSIFEVLYRAEVSSNLARYDGLRYGTHPSGKVDLDSHYQQVRQQFGPLLQTQIMTDLRAIASGEFDKVYHDALKLRRIVSEAFERIFKSVDVIISPMSPCIDGAYHGTPETDRFRPIVDRIAQMPALCGLPGMSIPCGFSEGLPVGMQIFGPLFSEQNILNAAHTYQTATKWHEQKPVVD
jgi:aspartyl-tRNA(Asn)/glutamyl-tRNA(Gln) amidotransferase subunit A